MIDGIGSNVYILGIGGISMSAIGKILTHSGHLVSGYDSSKTELTVGLENEGIPIVYDEPISKWLMQADTVVYTSAIEEKCPALIRARSTGKQVLSRAQALGVISKNYSRIVAVSGSHGKTTTTAMISSILEHSRDNFVVHVGGMMVASDANVLIRGSHDIFVTEACEYKRNFLTLTPHVGVILNLDLDHPDVYSTQESMINAFVEFSNNIESGGVLVVNIDAANSDLLIERTQKNKKIISYSLQNPTADYYVSNIEKSILGQRFDVMKKGKCVGHFKLASFFEHNLYNAMASIIVGLELGLNIAEIFIGLNKFQGVKRRFEQIGCINKAPVVLDYAHHPEELAKVINATKEQVKGKVYAVFQPHTYTRTRAFWGGFVKSLAYADSVVLYPIYPAREKSIVGVSSKRMAQDLRRINKVCYYSESLSEIKTYLEYFVRAEDLVLILGAGDIENFRKIIK